MRTVAGTIDLYDAVRTLPDYASLAAILALGLLLVLYLSQRRDLERLRVWMDRAPSHPAADLSASEALLDRAEAELEAVLEPDEAWEAGAPAPASEPTLVAPPTPAPATPAPPSRSPAARVTSERPALERITTERAALQPHPRWHRLLRRIGQPRVLGLVATCAVVLGIAAIFGSERLIQNGGESGHHTKPGAIIPGNVEVAVLNGTSVPGLAGKVGDDVQVNGFKLGAISNSSTRFDQTVVMYQPGQRRAAKRVAHDLGVQPVQKIDRQTEQAAGGAEVVVIAGADRAKP
jgi:LytR cell envelope-related transcriptional attenuator